MNTRCFWCSFSSPRVWGTFCVFVINTVQPHENEEHKNNNRTTNNLKYISVYDIQKYIIDERVNYRYSITKINTGNSICLNLTKVINGLL